MATRKLGFSALGSAIYSRLTTGALTSSYRVYNYAPRDAAFPFVTFGSHIGVKSESYSSRDFEYEENTFTVHVWSAAPQDKECADMMNNIVQTILGTPLSILGYLTPIDTWFDYSDIMVDASDPERLVRHGVMRFSVTMVSAS